MYLYLVIRLQNSISRMLAATWLGPGALSEAEYRWWLNADEMANDKLADGIRRFDADSRKLEAQLRPRILAALRARPE